jgi:hypothetical protein
MLPTPRSVAICLVLLCGVSSGLHGQASQSSSRIYYLTGPFSVTIGDKSYGFGTGTQFELVQDLGDRLRVKNGDFEFDVNRNLVTNDVALARQAWEAEVQEKARQLNQMAEAGERIEARTRAQIPFLTAISLDTGSFITEGGSGVRSIGNVTYINKSQTTTHILAVKVQLRTTGSQVVEPYEVQCFFIAKDKSQSRYIYDAIKFHSITQFDEVNVFARDLFGGTKTTDISVSPISGITSQGDYFYGTDTVVLTSTKPGSQVEGWIVRVLSRGQVVRFEASLSDLKTFAEWESASLDKAANSVSFKD